MEVLHCHATGFYEQFVMQLSAWHVEDAHTVGMCGKQTD